MELKDAVQDLAVAGMEALHPGTLTVFAQPCKAYPSAVYSLQLLLHCHSVFVSVKCE